jgi:multidrug resistance protein
MFLFNVAQVGPLILSPLSEIYGRRPILNYATAFFALWQIGRAAAPSLGSLITFRFISGFGGSACLTIGGGVISDMFQVQQRGLANAMFSLGSLFGPVIGPNIGGFIAQRAGWRWVYWVLLIVCGLLTSIIILVNQETNPSVLIRHKTQRLRKELGRDDLQSAYDLNKDTNATRKQAVLAQGIMRPLRMLFYSPILILLAIYLSFIFGLLYLIFTTVTSLFIDVYKWSPELCGLAYLGIGLGFIIGIAVVAKTCDPTIVRLTKANNNVYEPEMRLASSIIFAFFIPISFFWYGWSADKHTHWVVPIIGLLPFGFSMMGIFAPIQTYFIDVSGPYAASAVAGLTAVRCVFGAFLPLVGQSMYSSLGLGLGNSLLGFITLGLIPVPALIYRYGGVV